jgi:hypothetical protein
MAKCKVVSSPDYELTLSIEEKDALCRILGKQTRQQSERWQITTEEHNTGYDIFKAIDLR